MEQYYDIVCAVKVGADAKNEEKKHVFSFKSSKFSPRRGSSKSHFFTKLNSSFLIHKVLFSRLNQTIGLTNIMKAYAWLQGMSQRFECVRALSFVVITCSKIKSAVICTGR